MLYGGRTGSPSPTRRSSIERLQKASRVKNSNILALEQKQEYDPTRVPKIERPLAKVQGNAFGTYSTGTFNAPDRSERPSIDFSNSQSSTSDLTMTGQRSDVSREDATSPRPLSRDDGSPIKSAMSPSKFKASFDHETGTWSADTSINERELPPGRGFHRHAKSVTFDAAPPQINEYEMATPDISSVGTNSREGSYDSLDDDDDDDSILYNGMDGDLHEDSFDASLEDTDKTPVVGPDDWRGDSPMTPGRTTGQWDGSPMPESTPPAYGRQQARRSDSSNSNGDHRPLPPLPGMGHTRSHSAGSAPDSPSLSATAERMLGSHRTLPSPPPASVAKSDIQNIGNPKMTLEERLKLMMLSEDGNGKTAAEQQRERRLRRANGRDRFGSPSSEPESITSGLEADEVDDTIGDISGLDDYQLPKRISRESIMARVNGNKDSEKEFDYNFSSPVPDSPQRSATRSRSPVEREPSLDPDVPIPSTEDSMLDMDDEEESIMEGSVIINRDAATYEDDDESDILMSEYSDMDREESFDSEGSIRRDDETGSQYSDQIELPPLDDNEKLSDDEGAATPRGGTPVQEKSNGLTGALPDLGPKHAAFSQDFESYMVPKSEQAEVEEPKPEKIVEERSDSQRPRTPERRRMSKPEYDGSGWGEPDEFDDEEPGTPDSVVHHPVNEDQDQEPEEGDSDQIQLPSPAEVPERVATIKASGSRLKTRVSNTPSDLAAMREARRQVSVEVPIVPPIPDKHRAHTSQDLATESAASGETTTDILDRHPSFKDRSLTLDLDLGLSLDQDFDRVIENQKVAIDPSYINQAQQHPRVHGSQVSAMAPHNISRQASAATPQNVATSVRSTNYTNVTNRRQRGYLMRQNTKLVTASDKDGDESWKARSAGNSPVKTSRPQSWTVEPWNSKTRRSSVRKTSGSGNHAPRGPVPPMPGQQSNATALGQVAEEEPAVEAAAPESGERGRLFVKVMGVKDLDLPIPKSELLEIFNRPSTCMLTTVDERTWFSLTLDNGVHCVTTAWLELARNAPIGQEFELVVPNDLEFQLTLNVKLDKPPPIQLNGSTAKTAKPKASTFSRVFASPKKRKEMDLRQREEEERAQRDAQARQRGPPNSAYELLSPLAADDGSFARSYVCLKEHEQRCFGRPYMAEIACFNEWATEEAGFASSVKSKRGNTAVVRRAPYKIGKLEVQMLFVPRPKNSAEEDMPKSMNSCIRELKAAEERLSRNWEGHLSQQGGDCPVSAT